MEKRKAIHPQKPHATSQPLPNQNKLSGWVPTSGAVMQVQGLRDRSVVQTKCLANSSLASCVHTDAVKMLCRHRASTMARYHSLRYPAGRVEHHNDRAMASAVLSMAMALLATAPPLTTATPGGYGSYGDGPDAADYVIIGGGTAGSAVAARLCAALPQATMVVLERGAPRTAEEDLFVESPRLTFYSWAVPGVTEVWLSEPNEATLPPGQQYEVLTGTTLGGTTAINAAQWTKPPLATVAAWGFAGASTSLGHATVARVG